MVDSQGPPEEGGSHRGNGKAGPPPERRNLFAVVERGTERVVALTSDNVDAARIAVRWTKGPRRYYVRHAEVELWVSLGEKWDGSG